jgi:hypothetical protein
MTQENNDNSLFSKETLDSFEMMKIQGGEDGFWLIFCPAHGNCGCIKVGCPENHTTCTQKDGGLACDSTIVSDIKMSPCLGGGGGGTIKDSICSTPPPTLKDSLC